MNVAKIEKLEDLVHLDKGSTITGHKIKRLTAAGENYGSLMLTVDITVATAKGKKETIPAVAKMVPPNEFLQEVFNTQITFRNEIGFYKNIVPALTAFQKEQGMEELIDFAPKHYGSRINLIGDSTRKVDSDAVLLLENLKVANYEMWERTQGFDLETSRMIVTELAHLHAVPLALKLKKPDIFEKEVKAYLKTLEFKGDENGQNKLLGLIESIDECKPYFQRVKAVLQNEPKMEKREPFATIAHNDVWVNNIMIKSEEGRSRKIKLVDFQACDYGSPAKDLLFFIFSSVRNDILEKYHDDLIKLYHDTFIRILEELKCSTEAFSFEEFTKELKYEAPSQFVHTAYMFFPIFAPKGSVAELDEFKPEDFMKNAAAPSDEHKEKMAVVVKEFVKKNWI